MGLKVMAEVDGFPQLLSWWSRAVPLTAQPQKLVEVAILRA